MNYYNVLHGEFTKESDRAAVILVAAIIDDLLRSCLASRFVATTSNEDALFDGANSALGNFSSRIEMSYRLGLVSPRFARDLGLIRKIRNDFAHHIHGCSFDDPKVKSRVTELNRSHGIIDRSSQHHPHLAKLSVRDQFLEAASWMVYYLQDMTEKITGLDAAETEWGYSFAYPPPEPTPENKEINVTDTAADPFAPNPA